MAPACRIGAYGKSHFHIQFEGSLKNDEGQFFLSFVYNFLVGGEATLAADLITPVFSQFLAALAAKK